MLASHLWFFHALGAAICWGFGYALDERILKSGITPAFMMLFHALLIIPIYGVLAFRDGSTASQITLLANNKTLLFWTVLSSLAVVCGNLAILYSIAGKNATLASIVEISYPLFVALFAWILFKDVQLGLKDVLGAVLIFSGLALIFTKNT